MYACTDKPCKKKYHAYASINVYYVYIDVKLPIHDVPVEINCSFNS